jgi:drug/metabolite transporter (DMT)-like permease
VFVFLAARFTLPALLMAAFRPHVFGTLKNEELLAGAALGFFMFGGYAFQTAGLQYTTAAKAGSVTALVSSWFRCSASLGDAAFAQTVSSCSRLPAIPRL